MSAVACLISARIRQGVRPSIPCSTSRKCTNDRPGLPRRIYWVLRGDDSDDWEPIDSQHP